MRCYFVFSAALGLPAFTPSIFAAALPLLARFFRGSLLIVVVESAQTRPPSFSHLSRAFFLRRFRKLRSGITHHHLILCRLTRADRSRSLYSCFSSEGRTTSTVHRASVTIVVETLPNRKRSNALLKSRVPTKMQSAFHLSASSISSCFGFPAQVRRQPLRSRTREGKGLPRWLAPEFSPCPSFRVEQGRG